VDITCVQEMRWIYFINLSNSWHMLMEDARKLGERNWRNGARNKDSWQKLLMKAWAKKGLLCQ